MFLLALAGIVSGLLAASNFVIERLPDAKDLIEKLSPYQAMIGLVSLILALLQLFNLFGSNVNMVLLSRIVALGCVGATVVVGFLLSFPMINKFIAEQDETGNAKEKAEMMRKKLSPYQVTAGLVSMGTGAYLLVTSIF